MGLFDKLKWNMAHFRMKRAAESGDIQAQLELADDYLEVNKYEEAWKWYEAAAVNGSIPAQLKLAKLATIGSQKNYQLARAWFLRAINSDEFNLAEHLIEITPEDLSGMMRVKNLTLVSTASIQAVVSIWSDVKPALFRDDLRGLLSRIKQEYVFRLKNQINATAEEFVNSDDHSSELALQFVELYHRLFARPEGKSDIDGFSSELLIKLREIAQSKIEAELESYQSEISEMSNNSIARYLNVSFGCYQRQEFWKIRERVKMLANYNERAAHIFLNWHITGKVPWNENSAKELEKIAQHFPSIATRIAEYTHFENSKIDFHITSNYHRIIKAWQNQRHPIGDVLIIYDQAKNKLFIGGYNREGNHTSLWLDERYEKLRSFLVEIPGSSFYRQPRSCTEAEMQQRIEDPEFKEKIIEDIYDFIDKPSFRSSVAIKARAKLWNLTLESQALTTFFIKNRRDRQNQSSYFIAASMLLNYSSVALRVLQHPDGEVFIERINDSRNPHSNQHYYGETINFQLDKYLLAKNHLAVCEHLIALGDYDDEHLAPAIMTHLATLNFVLVKNFCEKTTVAASSLSHKLYVLICIKHPELFDTLSPKFYDITKIRNMYLHDGLIKCDDKVKNLILHSESFFSTIKGPKLTNLVRYIPDLPSALFELDNNFAELLDREDAVYFASRNWDMAKKAFQRLKFSVAEIKQILSNVNIYYHEPVIENEFWNMALDLLPNIDDIVEIAEGKKRYLNGLESLRIMRTKPHFDEAAQAKLALYSDEATQYFLTLIEAQALKAQATLKKEAEMAESVLAFAKKNPKFRMRCGAIFKKLILNSESFFTEFKGPKLANLVAYIHDLPSYLFARDNNLAELLDREDVIYLASLNWAMAKKAFQRFEFSVAEIKQILCKVNIPNGESIIENEFWNMALNGLHNIDDIVAIAEAKSHLNGLEALSIMRTKPYFDEAAQAKLAVCFIETTDYFLTLIEAQALKAQQTCEKEAEVAEWVLAFANRHPIFRVRCGAMLLEKGYVENAFYLFKDIPKDDPGYQFAMQQRADALFAGMIKLPEKVGCLLAAHYYHEAFMAGEEEAEYLEHVCLDKLQGITTMLELEEPSVQSPSL